jgi:rod shape-determining protein MreD
MRWPVFLIFAFAAIVVQLSFRNVFTLHALRGISPDMVAPLAVFIAMFAQRSSALWGAWILGLLLDLAPNDDGSLYHVIGPNALGYPAGAFLVLQLRTMVFRRRALTTGFLTLLFLIVVSLVAVMLLSIRSWYPGATPYTPLSELGTRALVAVYSGVVAIPMGWLLNRTLPLWGYQQRGW